MNASPFIDPSSGRFTNSTPNSAKRVQAAETSGTDKPMCPKGSSFAPHVHIGPGEYYLTKGRMDVRGGEGEGGDTAVAPGYGYEACQALHTQTYFPEDSEFYMTFLGPLNFVDDEGNTVALITWKDVQDAWEASTSG